VSLILKREQYEKMAYLSENKKQQGRCQDTQSVSWKHDARLKLVNRLLGRFRHNHQPVPFIDNVVFQALNLSLQ